MKVVPAFAAPGVDDGFADSQSFTDIGRSLSGGFLLGDGRERPNGAAGVGSAVNGISQAHRAFFAAGSLTPADRRWATGLLSAESVLEAFSAV